MHEIVCWDLTLSRSLLAFDVQYLNLTVEEGVTVTLNIMTMRIHKQ